MKYFTKQANAFTDFARTYAFTGIGAGIGGLYGGAAGALSASAINDPEKRRQAKKQIPGNVITGALLGAAIGTYGNARAARSSGRSAYSRHSVRSTKDILKGMGTSKKNINSKRDINKYYQAQARKYHPDLNPNDPKASQKMQELNKYMEELRQSSYYSHLKEAKYKAHRDWKAYATAAAIINPRTIQAVAGKKYKAAAGASAASAIIAGALAKVLIKKER